MKICSKCFTEKDLKFFQKRKDSKDGYRSYCREYDDEDEEYFKFGEFEDWYVEPIEILD